ncbi:hypothetical protein SK128_003092 [Halocaridina rubra]|uniref:Uncharacterized protein n=1 Tax=Halocaridina rubra TaxID=373956 RepID=A0AAN9A3B2_HALRR
MIKVFNMTYYSVFFFLLFSSVSRHISVLGKLSYLSFHDESLPSVSTWAYWRSPSLGPLPSPPPQTFQEILSSMEEEHTPQTVMLHISEESLVFKVAPEFLTWSFYCFIVKSGSKLAFVYVNGNLVETQPILRNSYTVPFGGFVLLGQDSLGPNISSSLQAKIADLQMWTTDMSNSISNLSICDTQQEEPMFSFSQEQWLTNGSAAWVNMDAFNTICEMLPYSSSVRIFIEILNDNNTLGEMSLCSSLGGHLPHINTQTDREFITETANNIDSIDTIYPILLGTANVHNATSPEWFGDSETDRNIYLFYDEGRSYFNDTILKNTGAVCEIPISKYTIRGLCVDSALSRETWLHHTLKGALIFRSRDGTIISKKRKLWEISTWVEPRDTSAVLDNAMFPVGLHDWVLRDAKCHANEKLTKLKITNCPPDHFTCGDLKCIKRDRVCNMIPDCVDGRDEIDCLDIIVNKELLRGPPPVSLEHPLILECGITMINYRSFDIKKMRTTADFILHLRWKDPRIIFKNLGLDYAKNLIFHGTRRLWKPEMNFMSNLGADAHFIVRNEEMLVELDGPPMHDNADFVEEVLMYSSEAATVRKDAKLTITYTFDPDLYKFPFDLQKCELIMLFKTGPGSILKMGVVSTSALYRPRLLEYQVKNMTLAMRNIDLTLSPVDIVLITEFEHLFGFYLISIYMPTLLLVVVSYVTFYFDQEDFSDRIMVSLTALLVLSTFLSTASSSMARVSYFTFLDIWLSFCIAFVFAICLIHTCLQILLLEKKQSL